MSKKGRLRVQERGKAARDVEQGATFHVAPGVEHWHGAVPERAGDHADLTELRDDELEGAGQRERLQVARMLQRARYCCSIL
jgi:quercetin dioxygenase-like cupin family protein